MKICFMGDLSSLYTISSLAVYSLRIMSENLFYEGDIPSLYIVSPLAVYSLRIMSENLFYGVIYHPSIPFPLWLFTF